MILVYLGLRVHLALKVFLVLAYLVHLDLKDPLDLWAILVSVLRFKTFIKCVVFDLFVNCCRCQCLHL